VVEGEGQVVGVERMEMQTDGVEEVDCLINTGSALNLRTEMTGLSFHTSQVVGEGVLVARLDLNII
jgi:hypothetical protein